MDYNNLHWETLDFVKAHLYRRLANPLSQAIEILEQVQHAENKQPGLEKLKQIQQNMTALLNTVNAWATFITFKHGGPLSDFQFKEMNEDKIPEWVKTYLTQHTSVRIDFKQTIEVHAETFIEGLLLLFQVARTISNVLGVQITDAPGERKGVYVRIVFSNKDDKAPFANLSDIESQFDKEDMMERDLAVQFAVARDMMRLNRGKFNLQNNKKTSQQSFSAYFEAKVNPSEVQQEIKVAEAAAKYGSPLGTVGEVKDPIPESLMTGKLTPLRPSTAKRLTQLQRRMQQITDQEPTELDNPEGGETKTDQRDGKPTPKNNRTTFSW